MMDLSVVIVNYNVEYFLEQCLHSVIKASHNLQCEIWVVDNNSVDGSVAMVSEKFPAVKLIANKENLGFSKANNMAIRQSSGRYILLLNPDTLVEEDTLEKSVQFMDAHPTSGGLGVRMIDGKGRFLPESKRGLPTPAVAFFKIFGLSAIFPKSRIFGRYHLGFLPENDNNEVEILSGAYMMMRKACLDEVGLLDEAFFMYGEDIDLSYRILLGGYTNHYLADARIIHYKGESTKKSSVNYVFVFYRAMVIFAQKHFSARRAGIFSFFINLAIYLRAGIAIVSRFVHKAALPAFDFAAIMAGLAYTKMAYESYTDKHYDPEFTDLAFVLYTLIWMLAVYLSSGYDKPTRYPAILKGLGLGTIAILVMYALLPESLRFSRALILLGAAVALLVYYFSRLFLHLLGMKGFKPGDDVKRHIGIIASSAEYARITSLMAETSQGKGKPFRISPINSQDKAAPHAERLQEVVDVYRPQVLIFSGHDMAAQHIIGAMASIGSKRIDFKIAPPESLYLIGSSSVEKGGELFIMDINAINTTQNRRKKRAADVAIGMGLLLGYPLLMLLVKSKLGFLQNIFDVLLARKTCVGYAPISDGGEDLPQLKSGVLNPLDRLGTLRAPEATARKLNAVYARDYSVRADLSILFAGFASLGRRPA